ncbi:MAG: carboxylating nicotinate-nucleotide diphosphorylase [Planctomycetes bacterium]|nr:carboxylating nicotinate-nucleotide diphosphorylase [Planctomycetota bacterium]
MNIDFTQHDWNAHTDDDCRQIVRLAVREDLERLYDWTTLALAPQGAAGRAKVVARQAGVVAGLRAIETAVDEMQLDATWTPHVEDGAAVQPGDCVGVLAGATRDLLTGERTLLNLLGRLSGVASLTRRYVEAIAGTAARIYDTRKTTPGWRRLEKYAVRCGGGCNHRTGLFDAVLIKDNHLAQGKLADTPEAALEQARRFVREMLQDERKFDQMIFEVEVDALEQLEALLPAAPHIVLLDNMTSDELRHAVARRDAVNPAVELEASGGVNLDTVRAIAESGVDRISVGALTHGAVSLDFGLDWG